MHDLVTRQLPPFSLFDNPSMFRYPMAVNREKAVRLVYPSVTDLEL